MKNKLFIMIFAIILIIVAMIIVISRNNGVFQLNNDKLPLVDGVGYFRKETGKDKNGNTYSIFYYDSKKIDDSNMNALIMTLYADYGFDDLEEKNMEEGIQLVAPSKEEGKMIIATVFWDDYEAYIKYVKCDSTLTEYKNNTDNVYYTQYTESGETEEPYYDSETNKYFDSYDEYESYLYYENFANEQNSEGISGTDL